MRRIGPYQLLQPLGRGGMAEVWMGRREMMGGASKTVAIKLLSSKWVDDPVFHRMFLGEARLSMLLNHSNIVHVFDVDMHEGEPYMAMEWVDGVNLAQLTKQLAKCGERLTVNVSAYIIAEVLRALSYAHSLTRDGVESGIIHRDVSPHNVMLSVSGEVKLMDFGIARLSTEETSGVHVKGKLRYMPPEQLRGNARRPTVDLFAVGAILHEMIDACQFRSRVVDEARLYGMILAGEVPPLALPVGAVIPGEIERLRSGLLAANDELRIPTAKDALRMLYGWSEYRNCSIEVEELVQRFVGASAPRTGAGPKTPSGASNATSHEVGSALWEPADSRLGVTTKRNDVASDALNHAVTNATGLRAGPLDNLSRASTRILAGVVGGVAVLVLVVSLGVGLGWWGPTTSMGESDDSPTEQSEKAESAPEQGAEDDGAEPNSNDVGAAMNPAPEVKVLAPEPEAPPPAADDAEVDTSTTKAKTPVIEVDVEFVANDYFYVEVKIGTRFLELSPVNRTSFRPGTYRVMLRKKPGDRWEAAGKLKIVAGKSYRIEMLEPPGIRVVKH